MKSVSTFLILVFSVFAQAQVPKIMPLGDSITFGWDAISQPSNGGYRLGLTTKLTEAGIEFDMVGSMTDGPGTGWDKAHEGHSGWKIEEIEAIVVNRLQTYQPDVLLLMIGTNNRGEGAVTSFPRLESLLNTIYAESPDIQILLGNLPPRTDMNPSSGPTGPEYVRNFNTRIPALIEAQVALGRNLHLVDLFGGMINQHIDDGVHMTDGGYDIMGEIWFDALRQQLGKTVGNRPPVVSIVSPADHAEVPGALTISAAASDPDGTVERVDFLIGQALVGSAATADGGVWSLTLDPPPVGSFRLRARAVDDDGATVAVHDPIRVTVTGSAPLIPNLVGHWRMDAGRDAAVFDISGYGNALIRGDNCRWATAVPAAVTGLEMDSAGTDTTVIPHDAQYDTTADFTIAGWFRWDAAYANYPKLFTQKNSLGFGFFNADNADSSAELYVNVRTPTSTNVRSDLMVPKGSWTFIALSKQGNQYLFRVGDSTDTVTGPSTLVSNSNDYEVCTEMKGGVTNLRMYDRALTVTELDALKAAPNLPEEGIIDFTVSEASTREGDTTLTLMVQRLFGNSGPVGVEVSSVEGTALEGTDFTALSSVSLNWPDGDSSSKSIQVQITDDAEAEADEYFRLVLDQVSGGAALGANQQVLVTLEDNENSPPVAGDDSGEGGFEQPLILQVLDNDTDLNSGDVLEVISVAQGSSGTVSFTSTSVTYTPAAGFFGTDQFQYSVSDGAGGTDTALVTVTILPPLGNSFLIAMSESAYTSDGENTWQSYDLSSTSGGSIGTPSHVTNALLSNVEGNASKGIRFSTSGGGNVNAASIPSSSDFAGHPYPGWFNPGAFAQRSCFAISSGSPDWVFTFSGFDAADEVRFEFVIARTGTGDRALTVTHQNNGDLLNDARVGVGDAEPRYVNTGTLTGSTSYSFTFEPTGSGWPCLPNVIRMEVLEDDPLPPTAPGNLEAAAVDYQSIALSWTDLSDNETGFVIFRAEQSGGPFALIQTTTADSVSYLDSGLEPGTKYVYEILARNDAGDSARTGEASAITPTLSPAKAWRYQWFGSIENTGTAANDADEDGDSLNHLVERGLGLNPLVVSTLVDLEPQLGNAAGDVGSPGDFWLYRFPRISGGIQNGHRYEAGGIIYEAFWSSDLDEWNTVSLEHAASGPANPDGIETATYRLARGDSHSSRIFFRLDLLPVTPLLPANLAAGSVGVHEIGLIWQDQATDELGYLLDVSTDGVNYTSLPQLPADSSSHTLTGLLADTLYYIRIRSVGEEGTSRPTEVVEVQTDPEPASNGLKLYHIGNSLTQMRAIPQQVSAFAVAAGFTDHTSIQSAISGHYLNEHWNGVEGSTAPDLIVNGDYEHLVLQGNSAEWEPGRINTFRTHAQNFHTAAVTAQDAQTWIYSYWPGRAEPLQWQRYISEAFEGVRGQLTGGKSPRVIPVGDAVEYFVKARDAGEITGIPRNDFYSDSIHPSHTGGYFISLVHYACLYGQSPVGLPANNGIASVSEALAAEMQEQVWEFLQTYPFAGVREGIPAVSFSPSVRTGTVPFTLDLDAGASFVPDGLASISSVEWEIVREGDSTPLTREGVTAQVDLTTEGIYHITATAVSDNGRRSAPLTQAVRATETPGTVGIGINFNSSQGASLGASDRAGLIPLTNWNNYSGKTNGSIASLKDSTGAASGRLDLTSPGGFRSQGDLTFTDPDFGMLHGFVRSVGSSPLEIRISSLPAAFTTNGYSVIVYCNAFPNSSDYPDNGSLEMDWSHDSTVDENRSSLAQWALPEFDVSRPEYDYTDAEGNAQFTHRLEVPAGHASFHLKFSAGGSRFAVSGIQIIAKP